MDQERPEEFRLIPDCPEYRVSNNGRVQSRWKRLGIKKFLTDEWKSIRLSVDDRGYHVFNLCKTEAKIKKRVHVLVLELFVGPKPDGHEGCHWNGIKTDNRVENLRWGTHLENMRDKHRHGTTMCGTKVPNSKLNDEKVVEMRRLFNEEGLSTGKIGRLFSVGQMTAWDAINRRTWRHVK